MDDAADELADVRLTNALVKVKAPGNKNNFFSLRPLRGHALLFPELFQTTSLGLLGSLFQKSRIGATATSTLPGFQVHFGAGSFCERKLFLFFDLVLQFQDRDDFSQVLHHGFSISVIGGPHNEIAAAIVFVSAAEGIFIDAIAVANGRGPNMCRLNTLSFIAGNAEEEQMITNSERGSFQHLGLGTLLLSLVERIASQQCADMSPSIFLKTNPDGFEYYKKLQLVTLPAGTSLPPGLSLLVPQSNYATSSVDRPVLVSRRVVRDKQPSPPVPQAARLRISSCQARIVAPNLIPKIGKAILLIPIANPRQQEMILILDRGHLVGVPTESVTNPRQSKASLILDRRKPVEVPAGSVPKVKMRLARS
jgi:hypothetical protein